MSDYTKTTNFTAKDSLPSGNVAKKILGSLFDTEFDAIATAVATKSNIASPTFTGTVTIPTLSVTGVTTVGGNIVSDTDSTDDLGTTGVRWANLFVDDITTTTSVVAGTATLAAGSLTDSSGAISFGDENLTTTGSISGGTGTFTGAITVSSSGSQIAGWDIDTNAIFNVVAGTSAKYFRSSSTGGDFYCGIENSAGSFFTGAAAYESVLYSPTNSLVIMGGGTTAADITTFAAGGVLVGGTLDVGGDTIIGSTSVTPDGTLHVYSGSAGVVTATAEGNNFIVEDSALAGMSILTGVGSKASIYFGAGTDNNGSSIVYDDGNNLFYLASSNVSDELRFYADNEVLNLTLSGASGSELGQFAGDVIVGSSSVTPDGTLHVYSGNPGAITYNASADDFIIENASTANTGMSLGSSDNDTGYYTHASPSNSFATEFSWNYAAQNAILGSREVGASLILRADNAVTNLTLSGASGSELATFAGDVVGEGNMRVGSAGSVNSSVTLHVIENNSFPRVRLEDSGAGQYADIYTNNDDLVIMADAGNGGAASTLILGVDSSTVVTLDSSLNATFAGAVTLSEGKVSITDTANEVPFTITSSATSANGFSLTAPTSAYISKFVNSHATTPSGVQIDFSAASPDDNTYKFLQCEDGTTVRMQVFSDGDLANHDGVYGTISDARLKEDFQPARSYWDDFKALKYQTYLMKSDIKQYGDEASRRLGLVAQEVEEVFPALVKKGETDEDMMSVKSSIIDGVVNSIVLQEAMERIEKLEALLSEALSK